MRKNWGIAFAAVCLCMAILILDSRTALSGAGEGVQLSLTVLIPCIFPFLFLSICLTNLAPGTNLTILRPLCRIFHIRKGVEPLLLAAFFGGYPAGAQSVGQLYQKRSLSKETSEQLLAFCNNAGPSFLFGMAGNIFSEKWTVWSLWLFHLLGALAASYAFPCNYTDVDNPKQHRKTSVTENLKQTISVMSMICGWVILFRVGIAFLERWILWLFPDTIQVCIIGLLELSNGICELNTIADEKIRFMICSGMLSLGGLCVSLQTASVTEGLSKHCYYKGKIIQLTVSLCCGAALMYSPFFLFLMLPIILLCLPKNKAGNPVAIGV